MNQTIVDRFMEAKPTLKKQFANNPPEDYRGIVEAVCRVVVDNDGPDPDNIQEISSGGYQGETMFITSDRCEWNGFWYVVVAYGSCSCCDTLVRIRSFGLDPLTKSQLDDYMELALHIAQRLKNTQE
jgi:hypothetical protein